jgi:hypothetical protein
MINEAGMAGLGVACVQHTGRRKGFAHGAYHGALCELVAASWPGYMYCLVLVTVQYMYCHAQLSTSWMAFNALA